MAEQSEITSSDLGAITAGATACDHLAELAATRTKFATFLDWIVNDADGNLATDFKTAIINQLLFDAAKKGWFVRTNPSTGYLELVQKVPLASLDGTGAVEDDIIQFDGTNWVVVTNPEIVLAPTSGGATVPSPTTGGFLSVAHGFSATPNQFRCFLECTATDAGYAVGDRIDALSLLQRGDGGEVRPGVTVGANATLVFATFLFDGGGPARKYMLGNKSDFDGDSSGIIDPSKWSVKFWAKP